MSYKRTGWIFIVKTPNRASNVDVINNKEDDDEENVIYPGEHTDMCCTSLFLEAEIAVMYFLKNVSQGFYIKVGNRKHPH